MPENGELPGAFGDGLFLAPLGVGSLRCILGEGSGDESGHDTPSALASVRQRIAHEVDATALPGGREHLRHGRLDALV